ncbi:S24 family peptidase [Leuconostoc mesenteroides]|uniref:S24 family peptidase n=1 Tax=Leuconostoc mesenteroides TaxID=1245 RepID=UPI000A006CE0|nr:S24 family peptidase [Leuconostoc mesenteroides]MBZ1510497.1 S24 family peptidase [Leuconostoc mesenteroides]ORI94948.1 XRE family transcriptional regulator [Leuconostoc mesenteroides subsp. mesenteroides]
MLRIYDKLKPNRQKIVYETAEQQYNEQNNVIELPTNNEVEIHGAVSAGTGEYLLDGKTELVPYDGEVPPHDFALVVNGDSMLPLFEDKQIIFVNKTKDVRSGQIVIADYDQQAYVKKLVKDENGCRLVSLNKQYKDLPINEEHETSIFGVVVL